MRLLRHGQRGSIGADGVQRENHTETAAVLSKREAAYIHMQDVLSRELKDSEKMKILPVVKHFAENDIISAETAADLVGKSVLTATRYLNRMIELGVIVRIGTTKGVTYQLSGL